MTAPPPPPPPQWMVDLNTKPTQKPKNASIPDPPGFSSRSAKRGTSKKDTEKVRIPPTEQETDTLKLKKAWEVAIAPAKQLPMNAIGMYMSGNSLQIFSIMMVFMLFKGPITSVMNINQTFQRFETDRTKQQFLLVKLAYVGCNLLLLGLGIWKVNAMGLLPTTRSDWLAWESERVPLERGYMVGDGFGGL